MKRKWLPELPSDSIFSIKFLLPSSLSISLENVRAFNISSKTGEKTGEGPEFDRSNTGGVAASNCVICGGEGETKSKKKESDWVEWDGEMCVWGNGGGENDCLLEGEEEEAEARARAGELWRCDDVAWIKERVCSKWEVEWM